MIDFPNTPAVGSIYTSAGKSWQWDGVKWVPAGVAGPFVKIAGDTMTGNLAVPDIALGGSNFPGAALPGQIATLGTYNTLYLEGQSAVQIRSNSYIPSGGGNQVYIETNPATTFAVTNAALSWSYYNSGSAGSSLGATPANIPFQLTHDGLMTIKGASSGYQFYDRTSGSTWMWYGSGGTGYFWNSGIGNIFQANSAGINILIGNLALAGTISSGAITCGPISSSSSIVAASTIQTNGGGSAFYAPGGGVYCGGAITSVSGASSFDTIQVNGVGNSIYAPNGTVWGAALYSNSAITCVGNATVNGQLLAGSGSFSSNVGISGNCTVNLGLTINGGGTALNCAGGSIYAAGSIQAAGNMQANGILYAGSIQTTGSGGTGLYCPGTNVNFGLQANIGGDCYAANFYPTSDVRAKLNVRPSYVDCLSAIRSLSLVSYDRQEGEGIRHVDVGVIAQDVSDYMPNAVIENPHQDGLLTVDLFALVGYLIGAVQQLSMKVAAMEGTA